ncbi:unnamed protein product [Amoebophrya sp. A25]|nr:unnamed protein product [Amoebophrya sp. A25]|eukprot:GSA25T00020959001.1
MKLSCGRGLSLLLLASGATGCEGVALRTHGASKDQQHDIERGDVRGWPSTTETEKSTRRPNHVYSKPGGRYGPITALLTALTLGQAVQADDSGYFSDFQEKYGEQKDGTTGKFPKTTAVLGPSEGRNGSTPDHVDPGSTVDLSNVPWISQFRELLKEGSSHEIEEDHQEGDEDHDQFSNDDIADLFSGSSLAAVCDKRRPDHDYPEVRRVCTNFDEGRNAETDPLLGRGQCSFGGYLRAILSNSESFRVVKNSEGIFGNIFDDGEAGAMEEGRNDVMQELSMRPLVGEAFGGVNAKCQNRIMQSGGPTSQVFFNADEQRDSFKKLPSAVKDKIADMISEKKYFAVLPDNLLTDQQLKLLRERGLNWPLWSDVFRTTETVDGPDGKEAVNMVTSTDQVTLTVRFPKQMFTPKFMDTVRRVDLLPNDQKNPYGSDPSGEDLRTLLRNASAETPDQPMIRNADDLLRKHAPSVPVHCNQNTGCFIASQGVGPSRVEGGVASNYEADDSRTGGGWQKGNLPGESSSAEEVEYIWGGISGRAHGSAPVSPDEVLDLLGNVRVAKENLIEQYLAPAAMISSTFQDWASSNVDTEDGKKRREALRPYFSLYAPAAGTRTSEGTSSVNTGEDAPDQFLLEKNSLHTVSSDSVMKLLQHWMQTSTFHGPITAMLDKVQEEGKLGAERVELFKKYMQMDGKKEMAEDAQESERGFLRGSSASAKEDVEAVHLPGWSLHKSSDPLAKAENWAELWNVFLDSGFIQNTPRPFVPQISSRLLEPNADEQSVNDGTPLEAVPNFKFEIIGKVDFSVGTGSYNQNPRPFNVLESTGNKVGEYDPPSMHKGLAQDIDVMWTHPITQNLGAQFFPQWMPFQVLFGYMQVPNATQDWNNTPSLQQPGAWPTTEGESQFDIQTEEKKGRLVVAHLCSLGGDMNIIDARAYGIALPSFWTDPETVSQSLWNDILQAKDPKTGTDYVIGSHDHKMALYEGFIGKFSDFAGPTKGAPMFEAMRNSLSEAQRNGIHEIFLPGHSLGAAQALYTGVYLATRTPKAFTKLTGIECLDGKLPKIIVSVAGLPHTGNVEWNRLVMNLMKHESVNMQVLVAENHRDKIANGAAFLGAVMDEIEENARLAYVYYPLILSAASQFLQFLLILALGLQKRRTPLLDALLKRVWCGRSLSTAGQRSTHVHCGSGAGPAAAAAPTTDACAEGGLGFGADVPGAPEGTINGPEEGRTAPERDARTDGGDDCELWGVMEDAFDQAVLDKLCRSRSAKANAKYWLRYLINVRLTYPLAPFAGLKALLEHYGCSSRRCGPHLCRRSALSACRRCGTRCAQSQSCCSCACRGLSKGVKKVLGTILAPPNNKDRWLFASLLERYTYATLAGAAALPLLGSIPAKIGLGLTAAAAGPAARYQVARLLKSLIRRERSGTVARAFTALEDLLDRASKKTGTRSTKKGTGEAENGDDEDTRQGDGNIPAESSVNGNGNNEDTRPAESNDDSLAVDLLRIAFEFGDTIDSVTYKRTSTLLGSRTWFLFWGLVSLFHKEIWELKTLPDTYRADLHAEMAFGTPEERAAALHAWVTKDFAVAQTTGMGLFYDAPEAGFRTIDPRQVVESPSSLHELIQFLLRCFWDHSAFSYRESMKALNALMQQTLDEQQPQETTITTLDVENTTKVAKEYVVREVLGVGEAVEEAEQLLAVEAEAEGEAASPGGGGNLTVEKFGDIMRKIEQDPEKRAKLNEIMQQADDRDEASEEREGEDGEDEDDKEVELTVEEKKKIFDENYERLKQDPKFNNFLSM